jgi:anaerobic selenocysteine-containing dehydrogenase
MADVHLKLMPGTDAWLLSALIKIMIENNYINYEFINQRTNNYDRIKKHFSNVDLVECLDICGISLEQLHNVAKIITSSVGVSINSGNGVCHSLQPFAVNYLIILLYTLTGNYQKVGGMNILLDPILPGMISDHYFTETHVPFGKQKQFGGVTSSSLIGDNLYINDDQKFHCVIIDNNNPLGRFPNSDKFKSQLVNVDIVIALDSFKTQSTEIADYILPVKTFFERYEVSTTSNEIAQLSEPIVDSNYAKTTAEIYELILEKLSLVDNKELDKFKSLFNKDQVAFYDCLLERYNNKIPDVYYILNKVIGDRYKDTVISTMWWKFFLLSRKKYTTTQSILLSDQLSDELNSIRKVIPNFKSEKTNNIIDLTPGYLLSALKLEKSLLSNPNYKFILQCGYRQKHTMNGVIPNANEPILEISDVDMLQLSLDDNDLVVLETESGEIIIKCHCDKNLQVGLIRIANHAIVNKLSTTKNKDYLNPQYKLVFANIRKINGIGQINN